MTAYGFCVVAALSSQTSSRPFTRSRRIGKSRLTACGSRCRATGAPTASVSNRLGRRINAARNQSSREWRWKAEAHRAEPPPSIPSSRRRRCRQRRRRIPGADGTPGAPDGTAGVDGNPAAAGKAGAAGSAGAPDGSDGADQTRARPTAESPAQTEPREAKETRTWTEPREHPMEARETATAADGAPPGS